MWRYNDNWLKQLGDTFTNLSRPRRFTSSSMHKQSPALSFTPNLCDSMQTHLHEKLRETT